MRNAYNNLSENLKGRDYVEDLVIDGIYLREIGWERVNWIHLA
jgi:hypothetical protein